MASGRNDMESCDVHVEASNSIADSLDGNVSSSLTHASHPVNEWRIKGVIWDGKIAEYFPFSYSVRHSSTFLNLWERYQGNHNLPVEAVSLSDLVIWKVTISVFS
jgi:hypothetical protein